MYLRVSHQVPSPDPAAGLYIRTRRHGIVQARIPADQLAYQMGEASQACARAPLAACPVRISTVLQRAGLHTLSWKFYEVCRDDPFFVPARLHAATRQSYRFTRRVELTLMAVRRRYTPGGSSERRRIMCAAPQSLPLASLATPSRCSCSRGTPWCGRISSP